MMRIWTRALSGLAALAAASVIAPAAVASTTAAISLSQSGGTSAGATHNLGLNIAFTNANPSSDSPKDLTLVLPPGLLANAAIDGGQCLKTAPSNTPNSACLAGTGTVTAQPDTPTVIPPSCLPVVGCVGGSSSLPVPVSVSVSFYLVAPPSPGDLGGLEVYSSTTGGQLGATGDVLIRPTGDPAGVGATIKLALPDSLTVNGANLGQISVTQISSTLNNLRYPAECSGLKFGVQVNSYSDSAVQSLSQPLSVTSCSALAYSPKFAATATKDGSDNKVAVSTTITQGPTEAPNRSVSLTFPTSVFKGNLNALSNLCTRAVSSCNPVGSVTTSSPLYPTPLVGTAYLTGNSSGLALTLVFPSPFPLTLVGAINLHTNQAAFTGLPDIPLTSLTVKLDGGRSALFFSDCAPASGAATAALTDQNGDKSATASANFSVAGCPGAGSAGSGGSSSSGSSPGAGSSGASGPTATAQIVSTSASGLSSGKPRLSFRVAVGRRATLLDRVTVTLPKGLKITRHGSGGKLQIRGVTVKGAKVRSLGLSRGRLVITLRKAARSMSVYLSPKALTESKALRGQAAARTLKRLRLTVLARDAKGKTKTLHITVTKLGL